MTNKDTVGRPPKVTYKIITKLADALQHGATTSDACRYAGISRDTYYRHFNSEPFFAEMMNTAKANQYKLTFNLLTI
jgi:AcrR family transcriptional regulator